MKIFIYGTAIVATIALAIAGCGEVTFKRGATADDMTAAERECRAATEGEDAYLACMRERGWFVMETEEIGEEITERVGGGQAPEEAAAAPIADATTPTQTPPPAAIRATVEPSEAGATETSPSPTVPAQAPVSPAPRAAASSPTIAVAPDPAAQIEVASWWKLGGTAAGLDAAIAACSTELGEAHRPAPGARVVTTAMRACLRRGGWRAVGEKPAASPD